MVLSRHFRRPSGASVPLLSRDRIRSDAGPSAKARHPLMSRDRKEAVAARVQYVGIKTIGTQAPLAKDARSKFAIIGLPGGSCWILPPFMPG
jgi:hypothetical protein